MRCAGCLTDLVVAELANVNGELNHNLPRNYLFASSNEKFQQTTISIYLAIPLRRHGSILIYVLEPLSSLTS
ncbi:Uncharacterized protein HZ326_5355 [Fusarium oxysporum f. sp. albedinis]|nr:Uncharacterized protein HZ326_5355 [Fusarium oxysporum f. sp. albedinis]